MNLWARVGRWTVASIVVGAVACSGLAPVTPVGAESRLRVDYDGSRLSVEAHQVSLVAVLREIGAKVGFTVVETAPSSVTVTFSDREAALDDVLRQLLRAENHTVFYRAGTGRTSQVREAIDRIGSPASRAPALPWRARAAPRIAFKAIVPVALVMITRLRSPCAPRRHRRRCRSPNPTPYHAGLTWLSGPPTQTTFPLRP